MTWVRSNSVIWVLDHVFVNVWAFLPHARMGRSEFNGITDESKSKKSGGLLGLFLVLYTDQNDLIYLSHNYSAIVGKCKSTITNSWSQWFLAVPAMTWCHSTVSSLSWWGKKPSPWFHPPALLLASTLWKYYGGAAPAGHCFVQDTVK